MFEKIIAEIELKKKSPMSRIMFWKKNRAEEQDPNVIYLEKLDKWQQNRDAFVENEKIKKEQQDAKNRECYEEEIRKVNEEVSRSEEIISKGIQEFLSDLTLPVEFSADYEYFKEINSLYVDLDVPEIEDLPKSKATISGGGKLSIKLKADKELKADYARCIIGLAFFFAGNFFNISHAINYIIISGYTQRVSKKTGNIEDQYVYSIRFDRDSFGKMRMDSIDPIEAVDNFESAINISSSYEMKKVEPLPIVKRQI